MRFSKVAMASLPLTALFSTNLLAAKIVGVEDSVERPKPAAVGIDAADRAIPRKSKTPKIARNVEPPPEDGADDAPTYEKPSSRSSGIGLSLGIGFGADTFTGSVSIDIPLHRYFSVDVGGFYYSLRKDERTEVRYGPESELVFYLRNPTILTPYAGAGLGYEKWQRTQQDIQFDSSSSATGIYLVGVSFRLAKHLSLQVSSKWTTYLQSVPKKFDEHETSEKTTQQSIGIGFAVVI